MRSLLIGVFVLAISIPGIKAQDQNAQDYLKAHKAFLSQDYDTALKIYKRFIEIDYQTELAYNGAINILYIQEKTDESVRLSEEAMEKFPNSESLLDMAIVVRSRNIEYYEGLIPLIKRSITLNPENRVRRYNLLGSIYLTMERTSEAIPYLQKALAIDPTNFSANYQYGIIFFSEALSFRTKANEADLSDEATYRKNVDAAINAFNQALPYLLRAHEAAPDELAVVEALMTIYINIDENEKYSEMQLKQDKLRKY